MAGSQMSMKRIKREIMDLSKEDMGDIVLGPTDRSMYEWNASIPGPSGSPYAGGVFSLAITLPNDYPFSAPRVVFKTPLYHPNVSAQGHICVDVLKNQWSPALSLYKVMLSISSLLTDPNPSDPLVPAIAQEYLKKRTVFDQKAREWTAKHAMGKQKNVPGKAGSSSTSTNTTSTPTPAPPPLPIASSGLLSTIMNYATGRRSDPSTPAPLAVSDNPRRSARNSRPSGSSGTSTRAVPTVTNGEIIVLDDDDDEMDAGSSIAAPSTTSASNATSSSNATARNGRKRKREVGEAEAGNGNGEGGSGSGSRRRRNPRIVDEGVIVIEDD